MTTIDSQSLGQAGGARRHAGAGAKRRLAIGAVAILALIALATFDGRPASQDPALEAEPAATFDGRGKWTGYAR